MNLKILRHSTIKFGLVFAALLVNACAPEQGDSADDATADLATNVEAAISVTAKELAKAYEDNEAAAQQKYGTSTLLVSGTVTGITLDFADDPVVQMEGVNEFLPVQLSLADEAKDRAASLSKGMELTLRCGELSEVIGAPMLDECTFH